MITSSTNAKIKNIVQLNTSSKARREQGVFVAEGTKMFLEAPADSIRQIFISESYYHRCEYLDRLEKLPYDIVEDSVFRKASDTMNPQGILCVIGQSCNDINAMLAKPQPLLMVLEGLQDPGNLGTIIRTGEGAGVTGIIMDRNTADVFNPKVIRATMGSVYRVPFAYTENLPDTLTQMKKQDIRIYAAHLSGHRFYYEEDYCSGSAFLIGNEGNGLSEHITGYADTRIKIPMQGQVESLNAAVSASVLMYEVMRQRSIK
ncbi:MAG: RNA methyltransferase [bacterium]|nr:RNA methyltransferase [bacterium]